MKRPCPCCYNKIIFIEVEIIRDGSGYYGKCDCGAKINYEKNKNGSIINNYSICSNGSKPSLY